jgi:hypothetical protein
MGMTEFAIELLRLRGDEQWSEWGDDWWNHIERLGELPPDGPGGWQLLDHFRSEGVRGTQLDWGALLYPVTKKQLTALYSKTSELRPPHSNPDARRLQLSELPEGDQYGLVVVECA